MLNEGEYEDQSGKDDVETGGNELKLLALIKRKDLGVDIPIGYELRRRD